MANDDIYTKLKEVIQENSYLKQELLCTLDEKEKLVILCQELFNEKQNIERRYKNLKNSKLGKITIWLWKRKGKKKNAKR